MLCTIRHSYKCRFFLLELKKEVEEKIDSVPPSLGSEDDVLEEADKTDLDTKSDGKITAFITNLDHFSRISVEAAQVSSRPTQPGVPTEVPYLLIGAGTASFTACRAIRATSGHLLNVEHLLKH